MRETVGRLIPPDVGTPPSDELKTLTVILRGHLELLIPEVEAAAAALPEDDIPRFCALACLGESRFRLRSQPAPTPSGAIVYARRLARVLNALCDHYQALTGVSVCLACDRPIEDGDATISYDHLSPSGGAKSAGRIHARCANTARHRR